VDYRRARRSRDGRPATDCYLRDRVTASRCPGHDHLSLRNDCDSRRNSSRCSIGPYNHQNSNRSHPKSRYSIGPYNHQNSNRSHPNRNDYDLTSQTQSHHETSPNRSHPKSRCSIGPYNHQNSNRQMWNHYGRAQSYHHRRNPTGNRLN
jgi:hypothetical protein